MPIPTDPISRRRFLRATAVTGASVAGATLAAPILAAAATATTAADPRPSPQRSQPGAGQPTLVPFEGLHQAGVDRPAVSQASAIVAAFDVVAADRDGLAGLLDELTTRSRALAAATPPPPADPLFPPPESGILGSSIGPADLTVTFGVGASLFDERFGLADRRPHQLTPMPTFPNDQLDVDSSHGDLLIQVCGVDAGACIHALRYLMAGTRSGMALRWMIEGFQRPDALSGDSRTSTRNLLGFKDGTANPGGQELEELVWVGPDDAEPSWATGGSYAVVRIIRMFVERWDRTALGEQEALIGRTKRTGAPLDGDREEDIPDYAADPDGQRIPLDAHIRLANPHTAATERNRILRRGFSYSRGFDDAGQLDQGLIFVSFQRDLEAGFVTVQRRLAGEPLEEYIRPVGGGYFFILPGVPAPDGSLADALLG